MTRWFGLPLTVGPFQHYLHRTGPSPCQPPSYQLGLPLTLTNGPFLVLVSLGRYKRHLAWSAPRSCEPSWTGKLFLLGLSPWCSFQVSLLGVNCGYGLQTSCSGLHLLPPGTPSRLSGAPCNFNRQSPLSPLTVVPHLVLLLVWTYQPVC